MLTLTIFYKKNSIVCSFYKLYNKKFVFQNRCVVDLSKATEAKLELFNNQHQLVKTHLINNLANDVGLDLHNIVNCAILKDYKPDVVVHKVSIGDTAVNEISRINLAKIEELRKLSHNEEFNDLELVLTQAVCEKFDLAKHYVCFGDTFHKTAKVNPLINLQFSDQYGLNKAKKGLLFSSILLKLSDFTKKNIKKGKWIVIYLSKDEFCMNSILQNQSHEYYYEGLTEDDLDKATQTKIVQKILALVCNFATSMGGIDGIVFTGQVGLKSPQLRQNICQNLEWVGLKFSNKLNLENKHKISKKTSNIEVFNIVAEPETFMLKQLAERL